MAAFDVDVNENNGRSGTFDFEDGRKFQTPDYVPSRADFNWAKISNSGLCPVACRF